MQRWKNIFFTIIVCLNCLLVLFVLAGTRLHVPPWLQVAGRMHPLVLHFPIVLLLVYIAWGVFLPAKARLAIAGPEDEVGNWLLLAWAGSAAVTALMGFLLSREEGYNVQALWWHKWGGTAVAWVSFAWYAGRNNIQRLKYLPAIAALLSFVLVIFTGHQGAAITHGENYLLAPVTPEKTKPSVPLEEAVVYTDMVRPILEAKCMSCHNSKKAKGELVMETEDLLMRGGKHGVLWVSGHPEASLLLQRIHLPPAEKKHMPPAGKPPLEEEETAILFQWIKGGANFKQKVNELSPADSLRLMANSVFGASSEEVYDFAAAADKDIERLNNNNRLVHPLALETPALAVNFYNRQNYTTAALKELLAFKTQVVSLDLAYMPLKEEDMAVITQFSNLRKLNLNFTTVPGKRLADLKKLPYLNHISLSGTSVTQSDLMPLTAFPKLHAVYVWNAPISTKDLEAIQKKNTAIRFDAGFMNDTLLLKLTPPVLETDARVINGSPLSITLRHYIKGAVIHYTTDGSTPDSIRSAVYSNAVALDKSVVFKARAFKPGWLGSDSIMASFYKNTYRADSIRAIAPLDSFYKGSFAARTLNDGEKGDFNRNGKWLGFRRNKMEMLLHYQQPVTVSSVTLSTLIDAGSFIMPPAEIEIWGGAVEKNMVRLARITPSQPDSLQPSYMRGYDCNFAPRQLSFIKVVAVPVARLPKWHPSKGQKGWIFTDEIFVN